MNNFSALFYELKLVYPDQMKCFSLGGWVGDGAWQGVVKTCLESCSRKNFLCGYSIEFEIWTSWGKKQVLFLKPHLHKQKDWHSTPKFLHRTQANSAQHSSF